MLNIEVDFCNESLPLQIVLNVGSDKALREASCDANKKLSAFQVQMSMKKDVFDNVCFFEKTFGLGNLSSEKQRYVQKTIVDGKRNGKG